MPTLANNAQAVKGAKLLNGKRTEYAIESVRGLKLHIYPKTDGTGAAIAGERKYYFHYFLRDGAKYKHKAEPIGDAKSWSLADAAKRAHELQVLVDKGRDPTKERHEQIKLAAKGDFKTFGDLADGWLASKKAKIKSADQYESRYKRHIKGKLANKAHGEIKRGDVIELIDEVTENAGAHEANRVHHVISAIFGWGVSEGHITVDPTYKLPYRHKEEPRTRALTPAELKALWIGLDEQPTTPELRSIYRLLMLLGQRKSEVAGMRISELDLEAETPVWTIPKERTKNKVAHRVPLPPMSLAIIKDALMMLAKGDYVFPSPMTGRPYSQVAVGDVSRRIRGEDGLGDDVRVHDLRRTVGTQMASLKISSEDRARVFNHLRGAKTSVTTKVYDVYAYDDEKLAALATWEKRLKAIVGIEQAPNVVPMAEKVVA